MNKKYWFTTSYRKREAKFQNNLLNEGKSEVSASIRFPPGSPGPVKDSGKFVTVLRRQPDGRWLVAVDMFSSDLPAALPPK